MTEDRGLNCCLANATFVWTRLYSTSIFHYFDMSERPHAPCLGWDERASVGGALQIQSKATWSHAILTTIVLSVLPGRKLSSSLYQWWQSRPGVDTLFQTNILQLFGKGKTMHTWSAKYYLVGRPTVSQIFVGQPKVSQIFGQPVGQILVNLSVKY